MPWGSTATGQWYLRYRHRKLVPDMKLEYDEAKKEERITPLQAAVEALKLKGNKPFKNPQKVMKRLTKPLTEVRYSKVTPRIESRAGPNDGGALRHG